MKDDPPAPDDDISFLDREFAAIYIPALEKLLTHGEGEPHVYTDEIEVYGMLRALKAHFTGRANVWGGLCDPEDYCETHNFHLCIREANGH